MVRPAWHTPPDARARSWASAALGPGWRVTHGRRLGGGIATAADALWLEGPGGARREVVLRRWLRPGWEADDPAFTPAHEAGILGRLAGTGLPVPVVLAVDAVGRRCGAPAVLAERLPGRRPTRVEQRRPAVLRGLGEALAAIHAVDGLRDVAAPFAPYYDLDPARTPERTRRAGTWARARELTAVAPRPGPDTFLHRDFHPGNTLWSGSGLTGIVDWAAASFGPAGADLGHLRANLGPDHGIDAADRALAAYAAAAGAEPPDQAWWDVRMLLDAFDDPHTLDAGRLDRIEAYLDAVLARA